MELVILSGRAHPILARQIAAHSDRRLGNVVSKSFADGEIDVQLQENVRYRHVVIIQPTHPPAEHWIELFLLIDAAR